MSRALRGAAYWGGRVEKGMAEASSCDSGTFGNIVHKDSKPLEFPNLFSNAAFNLRCHDRRLLAMLVVDSLSVNVCLCLAQDAKML